DIYDNGFRCRWGTGVCLYGHVLVFCRGSRSICYVVALYGRCVLGNFEMGSPCRRATIRSVACTYRLRNGPVHRRTPPKFTGYSCNRPGCLLKKDEAKYRQRYLKSAGYWGGCVSGYLMGSNTILDKTGRLF